MINKEVEDNAFEWAKRNRTRLVKEILSSYDSKNFKAKQIIFLS